MPRSTRSSRSDVAERLFYVVWKLRDNEPHRSTDAAELAGALGLGVGPWRAEQAFVLMTHCQQVKQNSIKYELLEASEYAQWHPGTAPPE